MMLKTVYGPPPADMERIDAVEPDGTMKSGRMRLPRHLSQWLLQR